MRQGEVARRRCMAVAIGSILTAAQRIAVTVAVVSRSGPREA
jgi:hypothetical protein